MNFFRRLHAGFTLAAVAALLSGGCAFHKLSKDLEEGKDVSGAIAGYLSAGEGVAGPFVVQLLEVTPEGLRPDEYMVINQPGLYYLVAKPGRWRVAAFSDPDGDLIYSLGDAAHAPRLEDDVALDSIQRGYDGLLLHVDKATPLADDFPSDLSGAGIPGRRFSSGLGNIVTLASPLFSQENGELSLWQPFQFLDDIGFGLFLLDELDLTRRQVVFVHGAAGTPRDWKFITDHLNGNRIQPWLYYYPSGFPLDVCARGLENVIRELSRSYGITEIDVVAHSMGGLVSRRAILDLHESGAIPDIGRFISISTPWQGNLGAKYGVDLSPAVVPSWRDMVPGSDFQKALLDQQLPPNVPYYLFFGFDSSPLMVGTSSDGTISLASMLEPRVQAEAQRLLAYNADHVGILNREDVAQELETILLEYEQP